MARLPANTRAVVTGAGSGLGRALCLDLAHRKARVVVSDVDREAAEETAERVRQHGADATVVECDVRKAEAVEELFAKADEFMGGTDLIANNAGVAVAGTFGECSLEDWNWIVDVNMWGVVHGCRTFIPAMRERGRGYVVNIASAAGLLCAPEMAPYNVTKAAVVGLSETLHAELKKNGVHVTVVCPTFFQTNIMNASRGTADERKHSFVAKAMARSKIQAPDVAREAIDSVVRNDLYSVPMRDGRVMWRLKRATPQRFYDLLSANPEDLMKRLSIFRR